MMRGPPRSARCRDSTLFRAKTVRLWEVASGSCLRVLEGHTARVWSVAFSPDGGRALSASDDETVRLWDVASGNCLRLLEGHTANVFSVAFSPDGGRALSPSEHGVLRVWEFTAATSRRGP